ncbi:hypothetical protein JOQ06_005870 [Pogonophryne albipinna]|uniref:DDE Tnp4 domain-containing protein n=1 Tax=Pogonophryne albipinna TaxID=1090488 RepID=A0AAD6BGV5_9TELE|nr:hypothetical protein JOQ06_005870 [Pogonophryne albipinna]
MVESLRNPTFGESLRDGSLQLPPDTVIPGAERLGLLPHVFVGDEAFPLLDNLLRPFPGRQITRERRIFNYRLSRARLTHLIGVYMINEEPIKMLKLKTIEKMVTMCNGLSKNRANLVCQFTTFKLETSDFMAE